MLAVMLLPRAVMDDFAAYLNDAIGALVYGLAGLRAQREQWAKAYEEAIVKDGLVVHGVSNLWGSNTRCSVLTCGPGVPVGHG
jgi:hypothetical protein